MLVHFSIQTYEKGSTSIVGPTNPPPVDPFTSNKALFIIVQMGKRNLKIDNTLINWLWKINNNNKVMNKPTPVKVSTSHKSPLGNSM